MARADATADRTCAGAASGPPRAAIPSWIVSLVLHVAGGGLLLWLASLAPKPTGAAAEADRTAGIVLVADDDGKREYFDGSEDSPQADSPEMAAGNTAAGALPASDQAPVDPGDALPGPADIGPGALEAGDIGNARAATGGAAPSRAVDGATRTRVFGVEGEGSRFVYVFDRSESMDGAPLAAAKSELAASLASLDRIHQFYIIFFNHTEPKVFSPSGQPGKLLFADEPTKQLAAGFVDRIDAAGGTRPEPALLKAVEIRPDVVFFLTDGDQLYRAHIERITRRNRGRASIHVVQFGDGAARPNRLLAELAGRNGGKHVYVDISHLGGKK
jgi:hypothetical protein